MKRGGNYRQNYETSTMENQLFIYDSEQNVVSYGEFKGK